MSAMVKRVVPVLLLLGLLFSASGCSKYNQLVELDATCDEKWANIETQLQRRYDLIPNLVATVKAQAKYEQSTLDQVVQARASATQIKLTGEDFNDPAKMKAFADAQQNLQSSLSRLLVTQEAYPDLKANAGYHDLMVELEGTENRIAQARDEYNAAVKNYNAEQRKVGGSVVNKVTGHPFAPRAFFNASTAAEGGAPKVDL
jgi:LemA protein